MSWSTCDRAAPTSRSAEVAAIGKVWSITSCSSRASRRWRARTALPRPRRSSVASSSRATCRTQHLINPNDDWWHQWFARQWSSRRRRRLPTSRASASTARRTKAMPRWRGRDLRCSLRCCGRATSRPGGSAFRSAIAFDPRLGLLAGLSGRAPDGAQGEALPRMAARRDGSGRSRTRRADGRSRSRWPLQ